MIDSHAHVNFFPFKNDYEDVIKRCMEKDCSFINVGSQFSTSERAVKTADEYENVYASVALHPIHLNQRKIVEKVDAKETVEIISRAESFDYEKYKNLAQFSDKVVAIGENGLDYYHLADEDLKEQKDLQQEVFKKHIDLANELGLPMIIHCREAYDDLIEILRDNPLDKSATVHCFAGNREQAEKLLGMGYYLGFTGVITFKNATKELHEIIKSMPEDRILAETDCPYLTPEPHRGKRNEPVFVEYVIRKIAELRGSSYEDMMRITDNNAKKLFNL